MKKLGGIGYRSLQSGEDTSHTHSSRSTTPFARWLAFSASFYTNSHPIPDGRTARRNNNKPHPRHSVAVLRRIALDAPAFSRPNYQFRSEFAQKKKRREEIPRGVGFLSHEDESATDEDTVETPIQLG